MQTGQWFRLDGNTMHDTPPMSLGTPRTARRKGVVTTLLDCFSNVWMGVVWASLFFIYCSVGSAMPYVRTMPGLEMTEFEWFHWWPFNALVLLFCTNIIVITLRRIPFRLVNAGVWMIHTGIVILCIGSYYYFGTKVEGDTPVFRRQIVIDVPGADDPVRMVALPRTQATATVGAGVWRFQVQSTNSAWPILSDEHKGESAYAVNVMVTPPTGDAFIRQLLAGYPQYTEDIIPGQGRAIKSLGRKLVEEDLAMKLAYEPQEYFHVMDSWALFTRREGESEWTERPIDGLPRFHDRVGSRDQVFTAPHSTLPLRTLDLTVAPPEGGDALEASTVRITGYLRYAKMQRHWLDKGTQLNPVLDITLRSEGGRGETYELIAFDRTRSKIEGGTIAMRWLDDASRVASLPIDARASLKITVPGTDVDLDVMLTRENVVGQDGEFTDIAGTEFAYRIRNVSDDLVMPTGRGMVSVAMVDIRTPEGTFTRMVADPPERTRDLQGSADPHAATSGANPHGAPAPKGGFKPADPRLAMSYTPRSSPIIFGAHLGGLFLAVNGPEGRLLGREVAVGETIAVVPGLDVTVNSYKLRAIPEVRPFVVPKELRQRNVKETFAMIRLEVDSGHDPQTAWVPFNRYALASDQYAYGGRFSFAPHRVIASDGTPVEVLFSRRRVKLDNPVALESFQLDTHVGGYSGQASAIRNYESRLSFLENGKWTTPTAISVNAPTAFGGYWYFQSTWDKPSGGNPSSGMNYTGLGVGNRNGVYIQLAGCCLSAIGMIFAFYVKPGLQRRRRELAQAKVSRADDDTLAESMTAESVETVAL